jgi:hypothetical protein
MKHNQLKPCDLEEMTFILGYLEQQGVIDCADSNTIHTWWLESRQGQESLTEFLVRAKIFTPAAITLLDLARDGYIREVPTTVILTEDARSVIAEVLEAHKITETETGKRTSTAPEVDTLPPSNQAGAETATAAAPQQTFPQIGTTLGKCLLTAKLGSGAFGVVYRALHTKLNIPVAVKVLRTQSAKLDGLARQQMVQEAQLLARIAHHRIVRVLDFDDEGEWPYLILEYVDGISLAELIEQAGSLLPEKAVALAIQACEGLEVAHQAGIIHRDIKPANLLMTRDGQLRLADLGLATVGRTLSSRRMIGTPHYVAPEQALGSPSDHRVDIYSLGVTLYEMLTGRVPFQGASPWDVIIQQVDHPPVPVHQINPAIPPQVWEVLAPMLAKQPEDRYQTATQAKAALERLLTTLSAAQAPQPHPEPQAEPQAVESVESNDRTVAPKSGWWWRLFRHSS